MQAKLGYCINFTGANLFAVVANLSILMTPLSGLSEEGNLTLSLELEGPLSTQEDISLDIEFEIGVSAGIDLQLGSTRSGNGSLKASLTG